MKRNYRSIHARANHLSLEVRDCELVGRNSSPSLESPYPRPIPPSKPKPYYSAKGTGDWLHQYPPNQDNGESGARTRTTSSQKWCWLHPTSHNLPSQYAHCSLG